MNKQKGFLRITKGSIGETTFVKTRDGFRAQEKLEVSAGRFKTDPAFARVRENASEFGRAGTTGKVIRNAISSILKGSSDKRVVSRLVQRVMDVIKEDHTSPRGQGNIIDGPTPKMIGFDFNANSLLGVVLQKKVTSTINRVTGELTVNFPAIVPVLDLKAPAGSTHYQLVSAGSEMDFEQLKDTTDIKESAYLPWDSTATLATTQVCTVTPNSTHPLFLVFGIKFSQLEGGNQYPILNGSSNVLTILDVNKP